VLVNTIHTGSILNLSNTGGGGRGSDEGDIVGTVILNGKLPYFLWYLMTGIYHLTYAIFFRQEEVLAARWELPLPPGFGRGRKHAGGTAVQGSDSLHRAI
jgi:hypothetical protein